MLRYSTVEKIFEDIEVLTRIKEAKQRHGGNYVNLCIWKAKGDNEATISAMKQQEEMIAVTKNGLIRMGLSSIKCSALRAF